MSNILTITFNPCIDKSTSVNSLRPDRKMSCTPPVFEPGGGGINVARAIKKLGGEAHAILPTGGYTGKFLTHLLEQEDISYWNVNIKNHTRENIVVLDNASNQQYRFGMPGTYMEKVEWQKCLKMVEGSAAKYIVASGSLPPGVPSDIYSKLAQITDKDDKKLIVDSSGEALRNSIKKGVYLIKPNLGELSSLANKEELETNEIVPTSKELIHYGGCEIVVVSMGAQGAMLITKDDVFMAEAPIVRRRTTVGAGDSMVAGITLALSQGKSLQQALKFGVACGTAATLNPGTSLCDKQDVNRLHRQIRCFKI